TEVGDAAMQGERECEAVPRTNRQVVERHQARRTEIRDPLERGVRPNRVELLNLTEENELTRKALDQGGQIPRRQQGRYGEVQQIVDVAVTPGVGDDADTDGDGVRAIFRTDP